MQFLVCKQNGNKVLLNLMYVKRIDPGRTPNEADSVVDNHEETYSAEKVGGRYQVITL